MFLLKLDWKRENSSHFVPTKIVGIFVDTVFFFSFFGFSSYKVVSPRGSLSRFELSSNLSFFGVASSIISLISLLSSSESVSPNLPPSKPFPLEEPELFESSNFFLPITFFSSLLLSSSSSSSSSSSEPPQLFFFLG
jgi:Na+/proline symporter